MKKIAFLVLFLLMMSLGAMAASVSRDIPSRVDPGQAVSVTFSVSGAEVGKLFTLEDDLPDDWKFTSWEVSGSTEAKEAITHRAATGNRHGWSFTASSANPQIKYVVTAPSKEANYDFDAVWFDPAGQSRDKRTVSVRAIKCGDNTCEGSENNNVCPADCPAPQQLAQAQPAQPAETVPVVAPAEKSSSLIPIIIVGLVVVVGVALFLVLRKKE